MDKSAAILIVDDYLLIRTAVRGVLADLGFFNVYQADNGKSAQEVMGKLAIDIVIGDWAMPHMSGMELVQWMRQDDRYARVPFMMLTAETSPAGVRTALQSGVNAYMIKPFTVHSFASKFMAMVGPMAGPALDKRPVQAGPVTAPVAVPAPPAPTPPQDQVIGLAPPLAERLKKCTVLIVDDIPTNIEVMAGALKDEYAVKVAINGRKAIEIAQTFHIDLILLDIMMPVMDGYEVCRLLKADPATADIPIIFLSARDGVDDVVAGLKLGAVDYVSKPADPTILKARLSAHLALSTLLHDLKRQNALLEENANLRADIERMTRHDLKSPIAVALQSSQALQGTSLNEAQRERVSMIEMAAGNALEMINRTLDVYKMENGSYVPVAEKFDLAALLGKVVAQTEMAFSWKRVRIAFPAPLVSHCLGEPLLCYSLLGNLLKNAAEASPEDGVVNVELAPGYGAVHVIAENQGEVAPALRERFFEKYATDKAGGTGLGTYSIRLMAEVQSGSVEMETGAGRTRLTVTLPGV
jgi:DNA-binding response OmpR family regulator